MTTTRRILGTGLGVAGCLTLPAAFASQASAAELPNMLGAPIADAVNTLPAPPAAPAPTMPTMPAGVANLTGALPSNLLRRNTLNDDNAEAAPMPKIGRDAIAAAVHRGEQNKAIRDTLTNLGKNLPPATIADLDASGDPNVIGQLAGIFHAPTGQDVQDASAAMTDLINRVRTGDAARDVASAITTTLDSDEYAAWRDTTLDQLPADGRGEDRAAEGAAVFIDAITANPVQTITDLVDHTGGVARLATDPLGALADMAARVLGPDALVAIRELFADGATALADAARDALPALLLIPAGMLAGAALGAPLGALWGSGLGALLGAANPINYTLAPLIGALLGGLLGALATGIPGLIGSSLLTLPLLLLGPLLGATTGSLLALAAWATVVFGAWLLGLIGLAGVSILVAVGLVIAMFIGAAILTPFVLFSPLPLIFAFGAAPLILIGVPLLVFGLGVLLTAWIPVVIYLLGAIPIALLGALIGAGLGLAAAALIAAIAIPLLTALSALPGAVLGSITGALAAALASTALNTLLGGILGGLAGTAIGAGVGALTGGLLATPLAMMLFIGILGARMADWWRRYSNDPTSAASWLGRALSRGWRDSHLSGLLDRFAEAFATTGTGQDLGRLGDFLGGLADITTFADSERIMRMLGRGGLLGAIMGAIPGAVIGAITGTLTGVLTPLNLLTGGLPGALIGGLLGALTGALTGSILSDLLGLAAGVGSIPLTFLPNLLGLATLWTLLHVPAALAALAIAIIPPLALATAATWIVALGATLSLAPLFIGLWLLTVPFALAGFVINGAGTLMIIAGVLLTLTIIGAPIGLPLIGLGAFVFGMGWGVAGTAAGVATAIMAAWIITGLVFLGLSTIFVGIPVFWLTLPLFAFPALGVLASWLLGLPLLIPMALGASILEAILIGSATDLIAKLILVPLGALLGAGAGALAGAGIGTLIHAIVRGIVYGLIGAGIGAGVGAAIGAVAGAITALITHLRAAGGPTADGAWADVRLLDIGGFGDILAGVPGLEPGAAKTTPGAGYEAVPTVALPTFTTGADLDPRPLELVSVTSH